MSGSENARLARPAESRWKTTRTTSARQPLGDVSPNIRQSLPAHVSGSTPMSGSPLKRSFTAAMADGPGFRYLKKRRLSSDTPLSQASTPTVHPSNLSAASSRNGTLSVHTDTAPTDIPEIREPTPTEPGTPTGSAQEENSQGSAAECTSFSSLINYDPSSQPGTAPGTQRQPGQSQHQPASSGLLFNGPSLATLLRLRLRVAMYKVQTDQIDVPFNDLQVEKPPAQGASSLVHDPDRVQFPRLLPAPVLRLTPHSSSRMMYESSMPSSPLAGSPEGFRRGSRSATPAKVLGAGPDEAELTSSIVKGRVAEGLLGLRNAV